MARLLIGVSGAIAAYKALETVRLAVRAGHAVRVIQTANSERFVGRASFQAITGAPVLGSEFEDDPARGAYPGDVLPEYAPISHLALVHNADAYLIAPASANTIARLAHGFAEDLLSTAALAATCPVALAPAMNHRMWESAGVVANVATLKRRGIAVIEPETGELASHGEYGTGRLVEPAALLDGVESLLAPGTLHGLRVLVTAGGTREPIDSVRFVGNRSSGRMGWALAQAAARRGALTTIVAANVNLPTPVNVEIVKVETASQLKAQCERRFAETDVLLMAAAVADFRPAKPASRKLKKDDGIPYLELEPTEDILSALAGRRREGQTIVGFAAEHGERALEHARGKLARKGLDAVVVNDISRPGIGFDSDENEVTIITASAGEQRVAQTSKRRVAEAVLEQVSALRAARREADGARGAGTRSAAGV